jgi:phosphatidylethanolamine/phosphatidyl-N-methylethanolamine N-methyltransferase
MKLKNPFFFRHWLSQPLRIAAVQPSSQNLCAAVAAQVDPSVPGAIVELGSGTGVIAQALIDRGVEPERLYLIELTREFCAVLRKQIPKATVLEGDVTQQLAQLAALPNFGPVNTVVSSLPIVWFELEQQRSIIQYCFDLMGSIGRFLQVSYLPVSPLPEKKLGLRGRKTPRVWRNSPPAIVWVYEKA